MWNVIGHDLALEAMERALRSDRMPHAWLFTGAESVGKLTAALDFAAALNCMSDSKPCGECQPCRTTLAANHPDVELVAPGGICDELEHKDHSESRDLRICQIRRLEKVLSLSPYSGGRRIAIIDAADTLHVEAANAFLKTLEEPPAGSVIILLAEREERLPDTVLSRCQKLAFHPVNRETILETLLERSADPDDAVAITAASRGRIGWALQALEDPALLEERGEMLDEAVRLAHAGRWERFGWAREAEGRAAGLRERYLRELTVWESWWRDVLLFGSGGEEGAENSDREPQLRDEGKLYPASEIVTFLRTLGQTREYLYANVDPQLALENLILDLPRAGQPATASAGRTR
jgi:DNA polymerase III subunit delta'